MRFLFALLLCCIPAVASLEHALETITQQELKDNLSVLTSPEYEGRGSGYKGDELASTYILDKWTKYGVAPAVEGYRQKFGIKAGRGYTWNVVGVIPGRDPVLSKEYVVVGAHYDHLGKGYPGADDNGSGTVALLEIAEALAEIAPQLRRTVLLVAFSAEERGLIGSEFFVDEPVAHIKDTIFMVNLDMVGYYKSHQKLEFLGAGSSSYMKKLIGTIAPRYNIKYSVSNSAGGGSDHVPFARSDVPVAFLHTGLHNYYHKSTDTPDRIDYEGLQVTAKIAFELVWNLAVWYESSSKELKPVKYEPSWLLDHGMVPFMPEEFR